MTREFKYFALLRPGPIGESTDNYALWRKGCGLGLPIAADTPKGLPTEMRKFTPKTNAKAKSAAQ